MASVCNRSHFFIFVIMNAEEIREYVLLKKNVTESFPFGEDTLVFKVNGKMFLLLALDSSPLQFNVKCDPGKAIILREQYPDAVLPGYHMNKKHWNSIVINGKLNKRLLQEFMDDSYQLVGKFR